MVTAGSSTYCYDKNGNQVKRTIGGSAYTLSYDAENRLSGVSGAASAGYTYDGDGKRVKTVEGSKTTVYIGNYFEESIDSSVFTPIDLDNPGFESTQGWTEMTSSSFPGTSFYRDNVETAAPHSGAYGYALSNHANGYLYTTEIAITPGVQYDLYAWLRGEIDDEDSWGGWTIMAHFPGADGYIEVASGSGGSISTAWQQKGGRFTAPAYATTISVQIILDMASGWLAVDDVSLVRVLDPRHTNLLALDGGFEFPDAGIWSTTINPDFPATSFWRDTWGTAAPRSGSYAYAISNHPYGYLESTFIDISPSTQYDLYAWVKGLIDTEASEGTWIIQAVYYNSSQGYISELTATSGGAGTINTTWQQKGNRITTPSGAEWLKIRLYYRLNSGWASFDDVSLKRVGYTTNLVTNPGLRVNRSMDRKPERRFPQAPHSGVATGDQPHLMGEHTAT